jgi:hypothetical protein
MSTQPDVGFPVLQGRYFADDGDVVSPVLLIVALGLDAQRLSESVAVVELQQLMTAGFSPVFVIDQRDVSALRRAAYNFEWIASREEWSGPAELWSIDVRRRLHALAELYKPTAIVYLTNPLGDDVLIAPLALADLTTRLKAADAKVQQLQGKLDAIKARDNRRRIVADVRALVALVTPVGARLCVISKGDAELAKISKRDAWHFPRADTGAWAGYHPANSEDAVAHLEALRAQGCSYLVIPAPSLWWLDFYEGFAEHLATDCPTLVASETCHIYALDGKDEVGG